MNISLKYIQNTDILLGLKRFSFLLLLLSFTLFFFLNLITFTNPIQAATTRPNQYAESTAESTWNTNTTYQDKVTLTFTPEADSTYVIISSWLMKSGSVSYQVKGKLTRTTGTPKDFNELIYQPKDALDYTSGGAVGFDTFGASPSSQTYKIQYATNNTASLASIKEAKIIVIKLTNKDQYAQDETRTTTQQTVYQDKTTLTFTPDSTDDYIIIASATTDGIITSYDHRAQLNIDGTAYSNMNVETNVVANRYLWATVKRVSLDNSEHTIKIQYSTESNNVARLAGIAHARIVALRADEFINNYFSESEARATTTSTSYQTKTTLTQTPQAYDHLVLGSAGLDNSSTSYSVFGQLLKGSTSFGEMRRETSDATSQGFGYFGIKRETLTNTSTSWYLQYRSSSTLGTAGIKNGRISLIELRQPSITVSSTGTQISQVNSNTQNVYIGGAFGFVREFGSNTVQSITVSQIGTIADSNISGLILYYKQEATCSTSIPGDATVFNSTPGTFSSGSSTVTGTMNVGTSQVCIYTEVDIGSGAAGGNTVEIQITNPSTGVIVAAGSVEPATAIAISGTTTIVVNNAPSFTAYSNNGPVNPGATVTFSTTASDADGNNITLVVCKTQGVTGTACDGGAGDTWCTSSSVASNPSCGYSVPSVFPDGAHNTYPYIFDSLGLGSGSSLQGTLATFTVNNVTPTVSAVTINGGTAISLVSGTTKAVTLTATVSDNNSCQDISSVLGYTYRSGVGYVTQGNGGTYYLNASDATISDPNAVWTNDANAFDGLTTTNAYTTTQGSTSSNYLLGQGSNSPTTGDTISSVRARVYNDVSRGGAVGAPVYTNSLAELLGTPTHAGYQPGVGDYVDSNTVGYWKLDEASGSGAYLLDSSGNNYHGTPTSTTFETGKLGGGRGFSVTTSKISIGDLAAFEVGTFTIDAYIYKTGTCNYGYCTIFSKGSTGNEGFSFGTILSGSNNVLHVRINDGGSGNTQKLDGNTVINNNTWYHVAAVVNSSTGFIKIYLNGNLDNSGTFAETIYYGSTAVRIGNGNTNEDLGFAGVLDEVRFSNVERTSTEISNYSSLVSELSVGDYVTLTTPSGGWTWTALNDLETKLYKSDASTYAAAPAKVELEVTTGSGTSCSISTDSNPNNCYPEITCTVVGGTCTDNTDASANYTCTANIYYYADPTGTNTQYPSETWMNTIKATDNNSATNALQVSIGVQMNMLEAMSITSSINYGLLSVQTGNDPLDRTTTSTPTGNVGLDHEIYGTDMCTDYPTCSASKILVTNQKYALTASTPYSSATQLTTTPTPVSIDISKPTTGSPTAKNMWWGMYAPLNTSPGSYSGTINVTAVASDPLNW